MFTKAEVGAKPAPTHPTTTPGALASVLLGASQVIIWVLNVPRFARSNLHANK